MKDTIVGPDHERAERMAMYRQFVANDPGATADFLDLVEAGRWEDALSLRGRNAGPELLHDWWYSRLLTVEDLSRHIAGVWSAAELPACALGVTTWVELFRAAAIHAGDGPIVAYRGTVWGRRRGMSWTKDHDTARWFAERNSRFGGEGLVFSCSIPGDAVLADLADNPDVRNEHEVVVDPLKLPPLRRSNIVS